MLLGLMDLLFYHSRASLYTTISAASTIEPTQLTTLLNKFSKAVSCVGSRSPASLLHVSYVTKPEN